MAERKEKTGRFPIADLKGKVGEVNKFVCGNLTVDAEGLKNLVGMIEDLKKQALGLKEIESLVSVP